MKLPPKTSILGVGVSRTTYAETAECVVKAAEKRQPLIVSALAVHGVVTGMLDSSFGDVLSSFDILTPDGQPVRWMLNRLGRPRLKDRVYGPALMLHVCELAMRRNTSIYLFGSTEEVVVRLVSALRNRFPLLHIAGYQADRFREATPDEDAADVRRIRASGAGIVFCGRGCPRQERWCLAHRGRLDAALVAVGAAFDFHAGELPQAPRWMQEHGLEWLFRLMMEPRRLWKRYLLLNPLFLLCLTIQLLHLHRFSVRVQTNAPSSSKDADRTGGCGKGNS